MIASAPADPLAEWTAQVHAVDGSALILRPLRADDRVREIAFINSLSQGTRYMRWLAPLRYLPPHLLDQLMDVDYHARMAFAAAIERDGVEEFAGLARYGQMGAMDDVELGVTVSDAWQRRGIARLLVEHLMRYAAWRGFKRICGFVLPDNAPMLALARKLGFHVSFASADGLMHISKTLASDYSNSVADVK
jgi:RimJ/RimL family protein N-acetyltransferase